MWYFFLFLDMFAFFHMTIFTVIDFPGHQLGQNCHISGDPCVSFSGHLSFADGFGKTIVPTQVLVAK